MLGIFHLNSFCIFFETLFYKIYKLKKKIHTEKPRQVTKKKKKKALVFDKHEISGLDTRTQTFSFAHRKFA